MKPTTCFWCATIVAACASISDPSPVATVRLDEARALLDSDPDRALAIADEVLRAEPGCAPAHLLEAEGAMRLAKSGRSTASMYEEAAQHLRKVIASAAKDGSPEARRLLAECLYETGEFEEGAATARSAAEGFAVRNTRDAGNAAAEARLWAGRCEMQRFVAARRAELAAAEGKGKVAPIAKETAELAAMSAACFGGAKEHFPAEATTKTAEIHLWLGQDAAAMQEFERGIRTAPQEGAIQEAYLKWMIDSGRHDALLGAYSRFVREMPGTPLLRWYQGRATFLRADRLRAEGNFQGATTAYDKALGIFGEYRAMVPAHADAAAQWIALCGLSACRVAVEMGDMKSAEARLLAAAAASPLATQYDGDQPKLCDSFGNHFASAAVAVNGAIADGSTDSLARTLAFNESVLTACPDRFGFVYNNAALAARDLGVQRAKAGDEAAARELWERSYAFYEKAVALTPDDARIVNDCGLMLLYHLDRDLDRARSLFDRAIAVGKAKLEALGNTAPAEDRQGIEEAIGDALQNIAVLLREKKGAPFAEYRSFCEESVRYFPYEQREAARMLREAEQAALPSTTRAAATAPAASPQGGAADALAKVKPDIDAKIAAQDLDAALTILDGVAKECREYAPYHFLRGHVTLLFARQSRDAGRKGTDFHYQDAVTALQRAVELDAEAVPPRQMLAEAQFEAGDTAGAVATASKLLLHLQSQGGAANEIVFAVHTLRARAAATAYSAKKQEGGDDPELLAAARASFRVLEGKDKLDATLRTVWRDTELWAGAPAEAVNVFARAVAKSPDDQVALKELVDAAAAHKQLPIAVEALQGRKDATGLWYLGYAKFHLAGSQRENGDNAAALKTLDAAKQAFADSMKSNAQYRDSCEQWMAMCLGKKGNIAFRMDDLANAETWLLESVRLRPDRLDAELGLQETTKIGILSVADKYFRRKDLGKAEVIYRAAAAAANSDVDLLNNAAFFARDHGNQLEAAGKKKDADEMYEQSYKAYRRAVELDPKNVRLRNDCALIAIHHLGRDWDLTKQMLDAAIADGETTLRDDPPDHADARQQLDEAVGDCYENLALWHLLHAKDGGAAKEAALQSQKHHPGMQRPGARRHLQAAERMLQGK